MRIVKKQKKRMLEFLQSDDLEMVSLGAVLMTYIVPEAKWEEILNKYQQRKNNISHTNSMHGIFHFTKRWNYSINKDTKEVTITEPVDDYSWYNGTSTTTYTTYNPTYISTGIIYGGYSNSPFVGTIFTGTTTATNCIPYTGSGTVTSVTLSNCSITNGLIHSTNP